MKIIPPSKKPRGKGVHIQSNLRSKDFEDIAILWCELNLQMLKKIHEPNLTQKIYEIMFENVFMTIWFLGDKFKIYKPNIKH